MKTLNNANQSSDLNDFKNSKNTLQMRFKTRFLSVLSSKWMFGILLAGLLWMMADLSLAQTPNHAIVQMQSLRGGTPVDKDNAPTMSKQERDHSPFDRDFVQQPPLIPHTIAGYQITANFNKCMDCHAWQKTKESGATKVSVTHFKNNVGQELDNISPSRFFCTQCHVSQTDAKPLVENTFKRARGLQ